MATSEDTALALTIDRLHKRQRVLEASLATVLLAVCVTGALSWHAFRRVAHPQELTLRRLNIVDEKGTPRVILAAPAPPPSSFGKPGRRDGPVSGVLLVDATGTERGGYVTSDGNEGNALLTLDAQGKQTVLLLAEPEGSTLFRIWDGQNGSLVMGSGGTGPFINMHQHGKLVLSMPEGNPQSLSEKALLR